MKPLFSKSLRISLLLGLLLSPTQNWCAAAARPGDLGLQSPSQLLDSLIEKPSSSGIDATYAVKNLLSSIREKFPELTVQKALSLSALLGIISENDVQLHLYGTFTTRPHPTIPGKTIKVFDASFTLPIHKITRVILDVLDTKLRPTALASNPFAGVNGKVLAKIMLILHKGGVQGLIHALEQSSLPKKKGKKGDASPESEEISLLDEWWEAYKTSEVKGAFSQKSKFVAKILGDQTKKSSEEDIPFIELLKQYASESLTATGDIDPVETTKQKEELSKILMTFLYLKDQKQKATGISHALEEYYKEILGKPFKSDQYTTDQLDTIGKTLLGEDSDYTVTQDPKGVEDVSAYLTHFIAGDVAFLQAPFDSYTSPDKSKSFLYCAEATIRSIVNSLLYNPATGKLDLLMLPPEKQALMNQKFKDFITNYPDPKESNYYGNSLEEWLKMLSGIDGVKYKQGEGKDAYEISGAIGPKNLIIILNHIFGTHADSFEAFGTTLSEEESRTVVFTPSDDGFDLDVTLAGQDKPLIAATILTKDNLAHAAFTLKQNPIIELLEKDSFRSRVSELSDYAKQSLYGIIFKPSILNIRGAELLQAIGYWPDLVKTMLFYGADANFHYEDLATTPLDYALDIGNDEAANELLNYGAKATEASLIKACALENLELIKRILAILKKNNIPISADTLEEIKTTLATHSTAITDEILPLLEQIHSEQSFGLALTTQEQKCITECVTKEE